MATSTYRRQPPPFVVRCLLGVAMDGIMTPLGWILEKLGRAEGMFKSFHQRSLRRLKKRNPFGNYIPGAQDVFVATYAKSGTNWMMQIVTQLVWHGKAEFEHIHNLVPWPDSEAFGPIKRFAIPITDDSVWKASPELKRAVKTHLNWDLIPFSEQARYILVIRDPKDVFVSGYHFFKQSVMGRGLSNETWLRLFQSENFPVGGSWAVNAASCWAERRRPNVLVLSFKSMKRDLEGTVRKVAEFLDIHLSEEAMSEVCSKSSFAYMKRVEGKFEMWDLIPWRKQSPMIRKGVQGGSSELLSVPQQREMDAYFIAELKRLGSDLPYEEFADITPGVESAEGAAAR
jgi:Sulfotransferase domain